MKIHKNDIFKFAPINEFTFKNLILSQLWFGVPDSMNDQLEGLIKIKNSSFEPTKEALKNFIKSSSLGEYCWNVEQKIKDEGFFKFFIENWFRFERNQFVISCFSRNPKESLMWSHYANKHTGLCLIYDKERILEGLRDVAATFNYCSINYKRQPTINLFESNSSIQYETDIPIISTKNPNWKYEKETRFYVKIKPYWDFGGQAFSIYHSALRGVIYGAKMDEEDIDAISCIFRNEPFYSNVIEYNANLDYDKGGIFFTKD